MTPYNIAYNVSTGVIVMHGPVPFTATAGDGEATATIQDGPPNPRLQRYTGTAVRAATPAEIEAYDTAHQNAAAARELDASRVTKTLVILQLWGRLGRQPTAAEVATERARFIAIYRQWP